MIVSNRKPDATCKPRAAHFTAVASAIICSPFKIHTAGGNGAREEQGCTVRGWRGRLLTSAASSDDAALYAFFAFFFLSFLAK